MNIFKEQINIIENLKINFLHPKNFNEEISKPNEEKKILLTIDDGFQSFYDNAWPRLKNKKIFRLYYLFQQHMWEKKVI